MTAEPDLLIGTPYSLPPEADAGLQEMVTRLRKVRSGLRTALDSATRIGLVKEIDRAHAYWSVFESNRIEFEGPDLAGTVDAIESTTGQDVLRDLNVSLLPEVLKNDRRAFAAIGLETARALAMRYVGGDRYGITQADLRSLHAVVMAGSWFAGDYRKFDAGIEQSEHLPYPTYKIPGAMVEFAQWNQRPGGSDWAVLRAAIGHAWFAHVHPFQDGNGRVARLLTNVMLGQDGLPPAIVKASAQRSRYIAALAHSDEGGDIMPLAGLFLQTLERYVGELNKPRTFKRMFDELVARRGDDYFEWYANCLRDFHQVLREELALAGLQLELLDELTREVFDDLRRGRRQTVLTAIVRDEEGQEMAIYHRRPSNPARARSTPEEVVPGIAFAVPNRRWSLEPYRRTRRTDLDGLSDFWIQPDRPVAVFVDDRRGVARMSTRDGASIVSDRVRAAFGRRFEIPADYVGSSRWLPNINGGPG
jgi:Fic family protein